MCVNFIQNVRQRGVCALNIGAKSNLINHSHKQMTPPLVIGLLNRLASRTLIGKDMDIVYWEKKPQPQLQLKEKRLSFQVEGEIERIAAFNQQ